MHFLCLLCFPVPAPAPADIRRAGSAEIRYSGSSAHVQYQEVTASLIYVGLKVVGIQTSVLSRAKQDGKILEKEFFFCEDPVDGGMPPGSARGNFGPCTNDFSLPV